MREHSLTKTFEEKIMDPVNNNKSFFTYCRQAWDSCHKTWDRCYPTYFRPGKSENMTQAALKVTSYFTIIIPIIVGFRKSYSAVFNRVGEMRHPRKSTTLHNRTSSITKQSKTADAINTAALNAINPNNKMRTSSSTDPLLSKISGARNSTSSHTSDKARSTFEVESLSEKDAQSVVSEPIAIENKEPLFDKTKSTTTDLIKLAEAINNNRKYEEQITSEKNEIKNWFSKFIKEQIIHFYSTLKNPFIMLDFLSKEQWQSLDTNNEHTRTIIKKMLFEDAPNPTNVLKDPEKLRLCKQYFEHFTSSQALTLINNTVSPLSARAYSKLLSDKQLKALSPYQIQIKDIPILLQIQDKKEAEERLEKLSPAVVERISKLIEDKAQQNPEIDDGIRNKILELIQKNKQ
jgi:hypothetical protein